MQTLIAQTNQNIAAQKDMSSMMSDSTMQFACEHCETTEGFTMNCSFPSSNTFGVNQLTTLLLTTRTSSRLSFDNLSLDYTSYLPTLPKKPPIS